MKKIKPFKTGLKKMQDEFDDYEDASYRTRAKKTKRVRHENFDDETDKIEDYDVYSY